MWLVHLLDTNLEMSCKCLRRNSLLRSLLYSSSYEIGVSRAWIAAEAESYSGPRPLRILTSSSSSGIEVPAVSSSSATFLISRKYSVILREFFVMLARGFRRLKTLVCDLLAYRLCSVSHTCFEVDVLAIEEVIVGSTDAIKALCINWSWRNQSLYFGLGTSWLLRVTVFYGVVKALNLILLTSPVLSDLRDHLKQSLVKDAGRDLFLSLYASWFHSPMAMISLCPLA
ncbi:hypothetical protein BC332_01960 [Capsicum chinense]|nr:hypothetical protein BC332_01960 [Capsicum chinense]